MSRSTHQVMFGSNFFADSEPYAPNGPNGPNDELIEPNNQFKCHISGCGKRFMFLKSLFVHRIRHKFNVKVDRSGENRKINSSFDELIEKQKNYRIIRLTDRSVNRWQKLSHRSDANYRGMQSLKGLDRHYRKVVINSEKQYICEYSTNCRFRCKRSQHMARHLNCSHIRNRRFKCKRIGCLKVFFSPTSLRQHELNHLCGFGIENGKKMRSVCSNQSINRFRKRIIENELKFFECVFNDCLFRTKSHSCIKRHIHNQHLCPHRIRIIQSSQTQQTSVPEMRPQLSPVVDVKPKQFDLFDQIDALIAGNDYIFDNKFNNVEEIEIIDDNSGERTGVSNEFKGWIAEKGIVLSYRKQTYDKCYKELEILAKIRPYFQRKTNAICFVCNECGFEAKSLQSIAIHLRIKHFIN